MAKGVRARTAIAAIIGLCVLGVSFSINEGVAFAALWTGSGGGGGGYSGPVNCKIYPDNTYVLGCTGSSWIFYKSVVGEKDGGWFKYYQEPTMIYFRPDPKSNKDPISYNLPIDESCSDPSKEGAGFWHFGQNAQAITNGPGHYNYQYLYGGELSYFASYLFMVGGQENHGGNDTYTYGTDGGKWGHIFSMGWGSQPDNGENVKNDSELSHYLYKKDEEGVNRVVYKATKYGSIKDVFEKYKRAYKAANGESYSGNSFPSGLYAFCYWDELDEEVPRYALTAYAITPDGAYLNSGQWIATEIVDKGDPATVEKKDLGGGYEFLGWRESRYEGELVAGDTYSVASMSSNVDVYAVYANNVFSGRVSVGDSDGSETVGPATSDANGKTYYVGQCSFANGCEVNFDYSIERVSGAGETGYRILDVDEDNRELVVGNTNGGSLNYSDMATLYPGQSACRALEFKVKGSNSSGDTAKLTICAVASGEETASINIGVKNTSVNKYNAYQKQVYAKPGDKVQYKVDYKPLSKYSFSAFQIAAPLTLENHFNVVGEIWSGEYSCEWQKDECEEMVTVQSDVKDLNMYMVGSSVPEEALINDSDSRHWQNNKRTPTGISFSWEGDYLPSLNAAYETEEISSGKAFVVVPYNYVNNVSLDDSGLAGDTLSAGEAVTIRYRVEVDSKHNSLTQDNDDVNGYATIVRGPISKALVYYTDKDSEAVLNESENFAVGRESSLCDVVVSSLSAALDCDEQSRTVGSLYENENKYILSQSSDGQLVESNINVRDEMAGTRVCIAAAIYPANSGPDDNLDEAGSNTWKISGSKCYSIAKKPTFQVWGGSIYSAGTINTLETIKREVDGHDLAGKSLAFSSWVEHSVVVNNGKSVKSLASGAASGYNNLSIGGENYGGSLESGFGSYCEKRVPLNISNQECVGSTIISKVDIGNSFDLERFLARIDGDSGYSIIRESDDITINSNVMDKRLYYTAGDININCGVDTINAMLIAGGNINTCAGDFDVNASERSNQLRITGVVYTGKKLILGRTFGAANGVYSYVPAEIINYDAGVVLSDNDVAGQENNGWVISYWHELPSRF